MTIKNKSKKQLKIYLLSHTDLKYLYPYQNLKSVCSYKDHFLEQKPKFLMMMMMMMMMMMWDDDDDDIFPKNRKYNIITALLN